ncbi:MAG: right-handed parallel beta-helix repeat-containing protein [Planctomycetota bacterium]|nr:right-handed parallel beta-helix repeat-containing protein [Planctomycetota bacterium]
MHTALIAISFLACGYCQEAEYFVAVDGKDTSPGTAERPFATLEGARDTIRRLKKSVQQGGIAVTLKPGIYERLEPFELSKEDSGTGDSRIIYRVQQGGEVRISGGKTVSEWKPVTDPPVLARLSEEARGNVFQADLRGQGITNLGGVLKDRLELFFSDEPMPISRWPNRGFIKITGLVGGSPKNVRGTKGDKIGKFYYQNDRPKRWAGDDDIHVHGYWFWDWSDQRQKVESIDTEKQLISVVPPYHGYGYRVGQWFYAFNLLSEIDEPGEWYLDRERGTLYFWPPSPIENGKAVVSIASSLITMTDTSHVTFRGLTFEAARGTAISIRNGTENQIIGCTIRNMGTSAVGISNGKKNSVIGCNIYGMGGGGISLWGGNRKTLTPASHVAENNHIHHYGRWRRMYQKAVALGGVGNRAAHNLIHNAPHQAMGFWGNDHVIEFNEIHSVCYESNDAGAIYAGRDWTMRGTVIRNNYLHHINGFRGRGCVGVYLDDMFSGTAIRGNVFYKVTRAAFIGGGRDCIIENNIFVDCVPAIHVDARAVGWARKSVDGVMKDRLLAVPYNKPPYSTRWPQLTNIMDDEPGLPKGNIVRRNINKGGRWDGIHGRARPLVSLKDNLLDKNPLFVDEQAMNFQLRDESPAYALGFKRIPIEKIGLYEDARRASWPVTHKVRPMESPPPKARPNVRKGPRPRFKVERTKARFEIDGIIRDEEWKSAKARSMILKEDVRGKPANPRSHAWLYHDGKYLYVAILNSVDPGKPLRRGPTWGKDDAVEIALKNPAGGKAASIYVLRGFPNGHFESSTESGVPAEKAKKAGEGTEYAARVIDAGHWSAEFKISFEGLGIDPAKQTALPCSISVRKTATSLWLMWYGTNSFTWEVDRAGTIMLGK